MILELSRMILVDTSVWIRFLYNRAPFANRLAELLERDEVVGHELIYGELFVGDRGGRAKLLANYGKMRQAVMIPHEEVVAFVRDRRLHGRGVGWIDVHLLASALVGGFPLWTADPRFAAVASEIGVVWENFPS
ncbi:MAG TPA: PIN domain-containing protein [Bryobacteraceae bacterium]|jgi:hypothetical protein|nr:PIN domain-containing protein [Bryobacteraceae bacterium]